MMGLLQRAYETYDAHAKYVGVYREELREPLAPPAHGITAAQIEITLDSAGGFVSAAALSKNEAKIIIPMTEDSSGRTSKPSPHGLCDQIGYIAPLNAEKYALYIAQLSDWAESEFSHPMLSPILTYVKSGTILDDLARAGIENPDEKDLVRWVVVGLADGGACWKNQALFDAFVRYYTAKKSTEAPVFCMVTGEMTIQARQHLKGIVSLNGNAKLISANDSSGFTYRGRFKTDDQASTMGYEASQKAHNTLKWLIANEGVFIGGRTFLCWNPKGKMVPRPHLPLRAKAAAPVVTLSEYRKDLAKVLHGYQKDFERADTVVIAAFDAATTGRLAVTYESEMMAHDFFNRLEKWDTTCVFSHHAFGISSPTLEKIVHCAFGTERKGHMEADEKIVNGQMQRLLACRVDGAAMPYDIMAAIAKKTVRPSAKYDRTLWNEVHFTACAVIRKYYLDWNKGEYDMALERDKQDISYQYGRLLAVLEKAERDTYDNEENREPNAIRMQSVYCNRPAQTAKVVIEQLRKSYYPKLQPGLRGWYERLIGEIYENISAFPETSWNAPLRETYIMGYYLQKNALYTKQNDKTETEE